MKKILLFILSVCFLYACSMPETKIYSIYLPAASASTDIGKERADEASSRSVVILMNSPRYLVQPYIAYRNSPYQLEISRYSKWESPPGDIVKDAFKNYLSSSGVFNEVRASNVVPEGFYSFEINLKKFERYDQGNDSYGELYYDIKVYSPDSKELYRATVLKKVKLDNSTFLCLAEGLSSALSESIKEVTGSLNEAVDN
ncbi:MAG: hypothetical protein FJ240_02220 [Nitrospira sp.]|nr:hypothetical protein [Nitrospira sp.]